MWVSQCYEEIIKPMSQAERLQLASQILLDLAHQPAIDDSDEWTEEDFRDFSRASLAYAAACYPEQEDLVA